jgi:acyl-coenzyme A thioesterase PaaI-like protein
LRQKLLFRFLNVWPPYLGSGVRVRSVELEKHRVEVELTFRFWNKNYVGTQFGGSLYAMCDPFFMLILMEALGEEYIVWDKAAEIQFKKPGKSRVRAVFQIPAHEIERIREQTRSQYKVEPVFSVDVVDPEGVVIAQVRKTLYVRRKDAVRPEQAAGGST